jgi:pilus assembly protein TadC
MFATFMAQSKFVIGVCVALSVAAFFVVKPWYYGLLAAIGVFIGTAVVRVPFMVISNKARDKRIDERTRRDGWR